MEDEMHCILKEQYHELYHISGLNYNWTFGLEDFKQKEDSSNNNDLNTI